MGAAGGAYLQLVVALDEAVVDEGDGQRQQHDATHHTEAAQHAARNRHRVHVPVPNRRHGDDDPPASSRDAGVVLVSRLQVQTVLQQLGQGTKDRHSDADENQQHHHLAVTAPQRQAERLQAQEVTSQFDHPEDPHDAQDSQRDAGSLQLRVLSCHDCHGNGDVVWRDGEQVDDVQRTANKLTLVPRHQETDDTLCCEPTNTHRLNDPAEGTLL